MTHSAFRRASSAHLLRGGEVGAQRGQQAAAVTPPANAAPFEEPAAVDVAVHVRVEQDEQLLVEILRGEARRHGGSLG